MIFFLTWLIIVMNVYESMSFTSVTSAEADMTSFTNVPEDKQSWRTLKLTLRCILQ